MSIHLVGGGAVTVQPLRVYGPFVAEAVLRARAVDRAEPRIGVVALHENDEDQGGEAYDRFAAMLIELSPCEPLPLLVAEGEELPAGALTRLDGLLVCGGLTPAYLTALVPVRDEIQALVADGVPYLGFSAGAAIAADRAIVGGWKYGDLVMCHEDNGEELDELTVADGLGLVDFSVDVHAVQWGNLGRPLIAVANGVVGRTVALDESTVWIVNGSSGSVHGVGQAWWMELNGDGVTVRAQRESDPV